LFIADPDTDFLPIPDPENPGVKMIPDPQQTMFQAH